MTLQIKSENPEGKRGIKKFDGSLRKLASVLGHVQVLMTPWTIACQSPLSIEFSRQKYWSGLPLLTPKNLPDPRIEPKSPVSPALAHRFFTSEQLVKP